MSIRFLAALFVVVALMSPAPPATAASYTFEATLTGSSEHPPVASPGTGFARVILDTIAHTLEIYAEFAGLLAPTTVAHIHDPTALPFAGNAGIAVQPPTLTGFPGDVTAGTYLHTFDTSQSTTYSPGYLTNQGFGDPLAAEAALLAHLMSGRAYFNIHTTAYPAGEIRGFFRAPAPIPLPPAMPFLLTALGALWLLRRRRAV